MAKDSFQPLIDQIAAILRFAEQKASSPLDGPLEPAIEKKMIHLRKSVENFKELVDQKIKEEGLSSKEIYKKLKENPELYSPHESKTLNHLLSLGLHTILLSTGLNRALKGASTLSKRREIGKNTKKSIQKRKSKFKGLDDGSKWKRL